MMATQRGVVDAVGDGVGGESAEDDGVDGADARTGQQSNGELGRHAHVDGDAIAFLDAESLEGVGELLHFGVEFGVGEAADFARLAFPDNGGLVAARAREMTVKTVVAEIELCRRRTTWPRADSTRGLCPRA